MLKRWQLVVHEMGNDNCVVGNQNQKGDKTVGELGTSVGEKGS